MQPKLKHKWSAISFAMHMLTLLWLWVECSIRNIALDLLEGVVAELGV